MNNENFEDLKQFIDGRISQSEETVVGKIEVKIEELRTEMNNGFAGVGEAIDQIHENVDQLGARVTKLEQSSPSLSDQAA